MKSVLRNLTPYSPLVLLGTSGAEALMGLRNRRKSMLAALFVSLVFGPGSSLAQGTDDSATREAFVRGVVRFTLRHELAHFLIDEYAIPVGINEEDEADNYAAYALGFDSPPLELAAPIDWWLALAAAAPQERSKLPWWDEHSMDERRAFQFSCLLAGMRPQEFQWVPGTFGAPDSRVQQCASDAQRNTSTWRQLLPTTGVILNLQQAVVTHEPASPELVDDRAWLEQSFLLEELARIIHEYEVPVQRRAERNRLPTRARDADSLRIKVLGTECGVVNAFYRERSTPGVFSTPSGGTGPAIIMCYEFIANLRD